MEQIYTKLQEIFADVFDDDSIKLTPDTVADDIEDWDSMSHITLIAAIEKSFKMRFTVKQVSTMQNVGEMAEIIQSHI